VVRNGHKDGRQRYLCHGCGKAFNETTGTAMSYSHSSEAVWTQVVSGTLDGVAISGTADALDLSREVVFNMRHKILLAMEAEEQIAPTVLGGVCELDETFVLESMKGSKLPDGYWREPRKHGAEAQKRGLSNEQVCICAGVARGEGAVSLTVNRATPSSEEIAAVFGGRLAGGTLVLCDGAKGYGVLEKDCACSIASASGQERGESGFYNINCVNSFHSFIKERYRSYRGVATKYLNRYNALFSRAYKMNSLAAKDVFSLLSDMNNRFFTYNDVKSLNLLDI
jgi:hypothetical protein